MCGRYVGQDGILRPIDKLAFQQHSHFPSNASAVCEIRRDAGSAKRAGKRVANPPQHTILDTILPHICPATPLLCRTCYVLAAPDNLR